MTTTATEPRPPPNGVNVPVLFATLDAVNGQKELAKFQFRATNKWISGTHSQSRISGFYGAGQEHTRSVYPHLPDSGRVSLLLRVARWARRPRHERENQGGGGRLGGKQPAVPALTLLHLR